MAFNPSLCAGCPMEGRYRPMDNRGPEDARFLVVTETVTPTAAKANRLMGPAQMQFFAEKMQEAGFSREDFRFAPACKCPYEPDAHINKEKSKAHAHCRQHLLAEIEENSAELVIPLGAVASVQAFGRAAKIMKVRGAAGESFDIEQPIFPLLAPSMVTRYPQNEPLFDADVASLVRYIDAGYDSDAASAPTNESYRRIDDLEFLIDKNPELIAFDTEGTSLRWYQQGVDVRSYRPEMHKGLVTFVPRYQILSMQFTTEPGEGYMLVWDHPEDPIPEARKPKLRNQLRRLLCDPNRIIVGQNLKYDNVALWMKEGIRYRIGGDTLMLAQMYDENAPEKNLDVLTKIHAPEMAGYADRFNATVDKSRMWETSLEDLLPYGCGDTDAAMRVYLKLEEEIASDERQWSHYCNVSIPGLNALAAMETEGMYTDDQGALADFKALMTEEVAEAEQELLGQIHRDVKRKVVTEYLSKPANKKKTAEDALSFTRADFLKEVLFNHPKGFKLKPQVFTKSTARLKDTKLREPSVSAKDHLPYFFDDCPFTMQLAEFIKDLNLLTKSVISFEKKYIVGGKVRPVYSLTKTVTGRTSSEDPNGQNYPKRGARAMVYRRMFVAPEGYYVCELDLSQAELRIAACMSGDREMIRIYQQAGDIHTETACIVLGVTLEQFRQLPKQEQKDARSKAKAVNFGFLYGMGWRKFIGFAKTQYGVTFTEEEAQRVRTNFFRKYKSLLPWHESMAHFARRHKYVRSFSGRIRHLPMIDSQDEGTQHEAIRQAINSPVQEFGSSLGVMALGRMNDDLNTEFIRIVGFIHDAIVFYVKKEYLDWGMRTVKRYMQSNPLEEWFGTKLQVPIVADCGFGYNLGEIHECEGFSLDEPFDYTSLVDKEGNPLIDVPPQKIPPNGGMNTRSPYTLPTDLEAEDVIVVPQQRTRLFRSVVSEKTAQRIARSEKQMVINRRVRRGRTKLEHQARRLTRTAR